MSNKARLRSMKNQHLILIIDLHNSEAYGKI